MRRIIEFFRRPPLYFRIIVYSLFVVVSVLAIILPTIYKNDIIEIIIFGTLGLFFFYSLYMLIAFDFGNVFRKSKGLYLNIVMKNRYTEMFAHNYEVRTIVMTILSFIISIGFAIFNAFVGLYYHSVWHGSISVYYMLLVSLRVAVLLLEYKLYKKKSSEEVKINKRRKMYILIGVGLTMINIALIFPIIQLQMFQREVNYTTVFTIVLAVYTFYKVIMSIRNFVKSRKNTNLCVKGLRNINVADAMVSILSLENTMLMVFTTEDLNSMQVLSGVSGAIVTLLLITLSIVTIVQGFKSKSIEN